MTADLGASLTSDLTLLPPQIRYRKDRAVARRAPCFPTVTSLQDLASGAALAATIHCYCPQLLRLEGERMGPWVPCILRPSPQASVSRASQ